MQSCRNLVMSPIEFLQIACDVTTAEGVKGATR
jgi:hypothetical protein